MRGVQHGERGRGTPQPGSLSPTLTWGFTARVSSPAQPSHSVLLARDASFHSTGIQCASCLARQGLCPAEHGTLTPALLNFDLSHQVSTALATLHIPITSLSDAVRMRVFQTKASLLTSSLLIFFSTCFHRGEFLKRASYTSLNASHQLVTRGG